MIVLYLYSYKEASLVLLLRIFLVGLIFSGILSVSFVLSLVSGIVSLIVMLIIHRIKKDSLYFMSVMSAIFHAIAQLLMAYIYIKDISIIYYLPIMLTLSVPLGFITALITNLVIKRFREESFKPKIISISIISIIFILSLSLFIYQKTYNKADEKICRITYQNELITEISLSNPSKYKSYSSNLISVNEVGTIYEYNYLVYNIDEKDYFTLTVEIDNGRVRISNETCKKHICSDRGYISTKYENIICLPNRFIVSISDNELSDIDIIV